MCLAYSGGLDTSIIIPWLKENYAYEVIAMVGDVGQGDDVEAVVNKAYDDRRQQGRRRRSARGVPHRLRLARAEGRRGLREQVSARHFARPSRDCEASGGSRAARRRDGGRHGCTGKGNDQVRFEMAYQALAPELKVIAPWREWDSEVARRLPRLCREARHSGGAEPREDPQPRSQPLAPEPRRRGTGRRRQCAASTSTWQMTKSPQEAPDQEEKVEIGFEKGVPVSVGGLTLDPVSLVELLNEIGGRNAIGRIDLVENRFVGIKSRGCYETPGGTLLLTAHRELEALCLDRDLLHFKQHVALKYAELVYFGLWFTPLREALDAFVETTQQNLTGTVTLSLYKGNVASSAASRITRSTAPTSPHSPWAQAMTRRTPRASSAFWACLRGAAPRARQISRKAGRGGAVKMWSGRFRQPLDPEFEKWQRSFPFDRLLPFELAASRAHANALEHAGVLSSEELSEIVRGLEQIGENARAPTRSFSDDPEAEDVHHFVEKQLAALIGATGYKLHTGRSRNEQIATDLRLFVRESIDTLQNADRRLDRGVLASRAEKAADAAMPAYTHLQPAEPVLVAHWLLAYVEMFLRDAARLADCRKRAEPVSAGIGRRGRSNAHPRS